MGKKKNPMDWFLIASFVLDDLSFLGLDGHGLRANIRRERVYDSHFYLLMVDTPLQDLEDILKVLQLELGQLKPTEIETRDTDR